MVSTARVAWVVSGILLCGTVARAGELDDARAHAKHAIAAYGLHDYATAAVEYEAAFKLEPDPALLYNAAQAHRLGGNSARALELYESYLGLFAGQVPNAAEVKRHVAELKRAVAAQREAANAPPMAPSPVAARAPMVASSSLPSPTEVAPRPVVEPAPVAPTVAPATPESPAPPVEKKKSRGWLIGVVVGVVVVVAVGVGVGVGVGAQPSDPKPSMGALKF